MQRGSPITIPALAKEIDERNLDSETRGLELARFDRGWAPALSQVEQVLRSINCPRVSEGGRDLALRSYYPDSLVLAEPEQLASNVFQVSRLPEVIHRFESRKPLPSYDGLERRWSFRKTDENTYLSFHRPPVEMVREYGIAECGGAVWSSVKELDGVRVDYLLVELLKKSLYAECRRRGLAFCRQSRLVYFPAGLFKNDNLRFKTLSGTPTFFSVTGERKWRRDGANPYRYHVAPEFYIIRDSDDSWEVALRVRVRITHADGAVPTGKGVNKRRKKLCKNWWNQQWLNKVVGIAYFLAEGESQIVIGDGPRNRLLIEASPQTWEISVRLNEEALAGDLSDTDEWEGSRLQGMDENGDSPDA